MSDYNVNVNVKVNPSDLKLLDDIEKRLQAVAKTPVKLNFDVEYKELDNVLNKLAKNADNYKMMWVSKVRLSTDF